MRRALVVCLTVVWAVGCSSSDPVDVDLGWDGFWSGIGTESVGATYLVEITISGSAHTINYPSIPCGGTLNLVADAGDRREFDEDLTTGRGCTNGGFVVLVRTGDQVSYEWFFSQSSTQPSVTGTLTRQPCCP